MEFVFLCFFLGWCLDAFMGGIELNRLLYEVLYICEALQCLRGRIVIVF